MAAIRHRRGTDSDKVVETTSPDTPMTNRT
jgi:hypothetical protein